MILSCLPKVPTALSFEDLEFNAPLGFPGEGPKAGRRQVLPVEQRPRVQLEGTKPLGELTVAKRQVAREELREWLDESLGISLEEFLD